MRDVRPQFTDEEYTRLRCEADPLGISLKQLVHDRAVGIAPEESPLNAAKILSDEISRCRDVLNQIVKRETTAEIRLYEDDVIWLEVAMAEIEGIVAAFVGETMRKVREGGNSSI